MGVPPALFASLVLLMATTKKEKGSLERLALVAGTKQNLKQSILDFRYIWTGHKQK
jgi:hypothetical protein